MKYRFFNRRNILLLIDAILVCIGYLLTFIITLNSNYLKSYIYTFKQSFFLVIIIYMAVYYFNKIYEQLWRYADVKEYQLCAITSLVSGAIFLVASEMAGYNIPIRIQIVSPLVILFLIILSRIVYKIIIQNEKKQINYGTKLENKITNLHRLAIVGAGDAGVQLLREIRNNSNLKYNPICFIDDNCNKIGRTLLGIDIYGSIDEIQDIVNKNKIEIIIISIPSANQNQKKRIVELCSLTPCKVKILPEIPYLLKMGDDINWSKVDKKNELISKLRNIDVEDLLQRDSIKVNDTDIRSYIEGSIVLVTGGGGSIGSEICRQVVNYGAKELIIIDNYENNAYEIEQELKQNYKFNPKIEIITVREYSALDKIFREYTEIYGQIDVVFHAAAHKHVPLMEKNPDQAVKNNLIGTYNVAEVCDKYEVKKMILISTDKAVNPTNVMGATKRACEIVIQFMNNKSKKTSYSAVRFGNVLGSNGSVIPLFKKQIEVGGPITVTHPDIIRYFMTIPEAVSLVLNAGGMALGGEVYVLDMGAPVKILDLAKNMIRLAGLRLGEDIDIVFTGLRPGEKLYEELLIAEEGLKTTSSEKIFIGKIIEIDEKEIMTIINDFKYNLSKYTNEEIKMKLNKLIKTYIIN